MQNRKTYRKIYEIVDILLAAYNGAHHLPTQLDSIIDQSYPHWRLWIRDDASNDGGATLRVINKYLQRDKRIKLLHSEAGIIEGVRLGVNKNFECLLQHAVRSGGRYFAFADQDDYWHKDKLLDSFQLLLKAEGKGPLLVYSDMRVVKIIDDHPKSINFEVIHPSFLTHQKSGSYDSSLLHTLLFHNFVTGCTTVFNLPLAKLVLPFPASECMPIYDWWMALVAAASGQIIFYPHSTVSYRQHSENQIGTKTIWKVIIFYKRWFDFWNNGQLNLKRSFLQAAALRERLLVFDRELCIKIIDNYLQLPQFSPWRRVITAVKLRLFTSYRSRQLLFLLRLFFLPRE
ncbi:MAG: glycosyltransferase family 2 protein [Oligoflexia bacterium]|nr:glycosyltransferase family 2 protein [Oligoflexia bacterium]